jgi:ABC-type dipeptide/oligopeptide/nickel transport system permease subunit
LAQNLSESHKIWQRFKKKKLAMTGLFFIVIASLAAFFGYFIAPDHTPDANYQISELALKPPGFTTQLQVNPMDNPPESVTLWQQLLYGKPASLHFSHLEKNQNPPSITEKSSSVITKTFWLGTDKYGRCNLSRLILGFRVSLLVGLIAVFISLLIGIIVGFIGGYAGGKTDDFVMLLINTVWSIPTLLLVFAIVLAFGRGIFIIFIAVGLTLWVDVARVVRGQVLTLRDAPFVEAARTMGMGTGHILFLHVLPNLVGPILVVTAGNFATAILLESGLSYLGFGVQAPTPSWGTMLSENYGYALGGKPFLAFLPAAVIMLTVLAFNLVGNGLRDALDVKLIQ